MSKDEKKGLAAVNVTVTEMTSTTVAPEVLDEIKALFSWNPPRLVPAPKTKSSTDSSASNCSPTLFYDKHFSSDLVLKKVVRLPSLVQDLAGNVDKVLGALDLETLPPLGGFITAKHRASDRLGLSRVVADEASAVVEFYGRTTARYCPYVASTLALHPSFPQWGSLLYWTCSAPSPDYANMDGALIFIEEADDDDDDDDYYDKYEVRRAAIVESMDSKSRAIFEEVRKSRPTLATWEMKSISTGSPEVMTAIHNLGEFSWTSCPANDCDTNIQHKNLKEQGNQAVIQAGPDARAPPWNLAGPVTQSTAASGSSTLPISSPKASRSSEYGSPMKDKGKKRARDDEEDRHDTTAQSGSGLSMLPPPPPPSAPRLSKHGSPTNDKGKKRKLNDLPYQDQPEHDITAQRLVQQAWVHAVRVDGTVIVIHSGNQELVCVRHRHSQTLYVSDVFEPSRCKNPGYGKLHIGIYVAAVQDIMDRWRQKLSESKLPGDSGNLTSGGEDQDDQDHNHGSGRGHEDGHGLRGSRHRGGHSGFQSSARRKGPADDEMVAIEKAIDVANNRDLVLLCLQYDVYDSPIPASFLRSAPSIMTHTRSPTPPFSAQAIHSCGLEDCLTIVLTSEIGRGATGVVHRGTLKPAICDGAMPLDVVVKLAFDSDQRDALRSEYEVYRRLKSKGVRQGIATALGFFDDSEGCACALVLLYAGVSLSESQGNLSGIDRKSALSILKSIHRAGILHGDIRRANILISDLGITIIDFGHSKQSDDQETKDEELEQLRSCLRLEGKH
ncbi:hypothetical protein F5887DRAFT_1069354 [Amanita rubescens]|nr:hypothetical protein F5887DRAFT_1069354 [Amanita rubescens]